MVNTLANIDFAADYTPSEPELNLAHYLFIQGCVMSCQLESMAILDHSLAVLAGLVLTLTTEQVQHILVFLGDIAFDLSHYLLCVSYFI